MFNASIGKVGKFGLQLKPKELEALKNCSFASATATGENVQYGASSRTNESS